MMHICTCTLLLFCMYLRVLSYFVCIKNILSKYFECIYIYIVIICCRHMLLFSHISIFCSDIHQYFHEAFLTTSTVSKRLLK